MIGFMLPWRLWPIAQAQYRS
jgi:hypothetical protein